MRKRLEGESLGDIAHLLLDEQARLYTGTPEKATPMGSAVYELRQNPEVLREIEGRTEEEVVALLRGSTETAPAPTSIETSKFLRGLGKLFAQSEEQEREQQLREFAEREAEVTALVRSWGLEVGPLPQQEVVKFYDELGVGLTPEQKKPIPPPRATPFEASFLKSPTKTADPTKGPSFRSEGAATSHAADAVRSSPGDIAESGGKFVATINVDGTIYLETFETRAEAEAWLEGEAKAAREAGKRIYTEETELHADVAESRAFSAALGLPPDRVPPIPRDTGRDDVHAASPEALQRAWNSWGWRL